MASLARALDMLEALVCHPEHQTVAEAAGRLGIPVATGHRYVATLMADGFLARVGNGRYVAGSRLLAMSYHVDEKQLIANAAAPVLHELAERLGSVVQLGTLDGEMVTYRIKTGRGAQDLFTRVGMQLEAYCSGIGKVLLAHLSCADRDAYLANGPFVPLTSRTIATAEGLSEELERVRSNGFATDEGEIADDLACLAIPIWSATGRVVAAISVSRRVTHANPKVQMSDLPILREAAKEISNRAFDSGRGNPTPAKKEGDQAA